LFNIMEEYRGPSVSLSVAVIVVVRTPAADLLQSTKTVPPVHL